MEVDGAGRLHRQSTKRGRGLFGISPGPNPTDRAKSGTKRHILTDGRGVPLAAMLSGANVHDKWMLAPTLDAVVLRAPRGPRRPSIFVSTRDTTSPTATKLCERGASRLTSGRSASVASRRSCLGSTVVNPDAGSSSAPEAGTIASADCSSDGSASPPTISRSFISRAH